MTDPRPIRRNPDVLTDTLAVAGKQLIDVGCGNGHLVRHLARHGAQVLGVECSPRQLAAAHAAARVADETIVEGVGQALPAADASADIVVFFNSLHHIPGEHMATALNEACRVLRADGVVYVAEPLAEGEFFALCRAVDDETQVRAAAQHAVLAHHACAWRRRLTISTRWCWPTLPPFASGWCRPITSAKRALPRIRPSSAPCLPARASRWTMAGSLSSRCACICCIRSRRAKRRTAAWAPEMSHDSHANGA